MSNRKLFRSFLNTRKSGKEVVKSTKPKKRKTNLGMKKGEGGLPQYLAYGLGFDGESGIGGESYDRSDARVISEMRGCKRRGRLRRQRQNEENNEFTFDTISTKAQFHDQSNPGHMNQDPRPLPNEQKRRRDLENQEEKQHNQFDSNEAEQNPEDVNDDAPDQQKDIDLDRMGLIRRVKNAHLVYKRQSESGTYEELWAYNIGDNLHDELEIRRAILAGTDIPPEKLATDDKQQSYDLWTAGNAQLLYISGLPN